MRFVIALTLFDGGDAGTERCIHRGAQRHASDEATTTDVSIMPYSSATRVGGFVVGSVEPICTMATSIPLVARASTDPMRFGLGMKP